MLKAFRFLVKWSLRKAVTRKLSGDVPISLKEACRLWALSDTIYIGPTGPSGQILPECLLYRIFVESDIPDTHDLSRYLRHENATVIGYAFEILLKRRSPSAITALHQVRGRRELVTMGFGCGVNSLPLEQ